MVQEETLILVVPSILVEATMDLVLEMEEVLILSMEVLVPHTLFK
jgi:hypothetical protein